MGPRSVGQRPGETGARRWRSMGDWVREDMDERLCGSRMVGTELATPIAKALASRSCELGLGHDSGLALIWGNS
jgi:hypothetical protein